MHEPKVRPHQERPRRFKSSQAETVSQQEALYRLVDCLHRASSLAHLYDGALDAILNALKCQRASILLLDEQGVMRFVAWRSLSERYRKAVEGHTPWAPGETRPKPICIANVARARLDKALKAVVQAEGIAALGFIPLVAEGKLIGKFMTYYDAPHRCSKAELEFAVHIARQLAFGIAQKRTHDALRDNVERLRLTLDAGRMGTWDWHVERDEVVWSPGMLAIHGVESHPAPRASLAAYERHVHPQDRALVSRVVTETLQRGTEHRIEYRVVWPDGAVHWVEGRGRLFRDEHGKPARMIGVCLDIDERKRREGDARFLANASANLAAIVDYKSTLNKVAQLAVPFFADWCAIDMQDDSGALRRVAVAHVDPQKVALAHELHRRFPPDPNSGRGVWRVLRTAQSERVAEISDETLSASVRDSEQLAIVRTLGLHSYIGVPLSVRGRVLGVITFITAESRRRYDDNDLAVAEDLAHRAAIAVENARLYQALQEADRRKDEFIALLGHELRNPLAPITNALQVLKLPGVDAAIAERVRNVMERQVEHLVRLVDDLLDVSRIMRGKVELRREPVELATVVARAVETVQPVIDAMRHELTLSLAPEPLRVEGDVVRLSQVVANLLNNAAKYTDARGKISLALAREGTEAVVRVRDTGVGIGPDMLPRIFDMFFQAERRTSSSQGGLGIGLSLVRGLVEMHGGCVAAYSAGPGTGSEFVVRLPLLVQRIYDSAAGGSEVRPGSANLPKNRVLVVDDNVDAADSFAVLLRLQGQEVSVAYDGASALAQAQTNPPSIAFLDLHMPAMDGYELARRLRAVSPPNQAVVLVALTGLGQPEDRQRSTEAGFDCHLVKPVDANAVRQLLTRSAVLSS
jgi:PAS domain S-box-containing protein